MHTFHTTRRVEFADTDLGGICHFSRYMVFMETAEHQFLEAIGSRVHQQIDGRLISWPRVNVQAEYKSPAFFRDELDIEIRIARLGTKSITYRFTISREGTVVALGRVTAVCCELGEKPGQIRSVAIPAQIADQLEEAPDVD